jgi:hypothetical protein
MKYYSILSYSMKTFSKIILSMNDFSMKNMIRCIFSFYERNATLNNNLKFNHKLNYIIQELQYKKI